MSHKLGICIPYRNREDHLNQLVPHLTKHLTENEIDFHFYVAHQVDEKLLNRGTLKNIAAKFAFEDGCDYVAWHDVDMLPDEDCDYTYPEKHPIHIATRLSKYSYGISYDQYFGGVVLFTKEQVEKTNGYSNEYWDWGQEDDDLFWRSYFEGLTTGQIYKTHKKKMVGVFNGVDSNISIPTTQEVVNCLHRDHTISILFKPEQQPDKADIWLVGDKNKKFCEFPLFRKDQSYNWGLSFNNSRAITMFLYDYKGGKYYNWGKRFENLWTWVTMSYSRKTQEAYFYINDELVCQMEGRTHNIPFPISSRLADHDMDGDFLIGHCSFVNSYYKGKIGDVKIHNKFFDNIEDVFEDDDTVLRYDFDDNISGRNNNVQMVTEDIEVIENILPFRRKGCYTCLEHENEGFVNGTWAKGETTARNEKRLIRKMQQRKIDYKNDGMNSLEYELISTEMVMDKCLMINVKL